MPRFHLNIYNDDVVMDDEGAEFATLAAAHRAAVDGIREMISSHIRDGRTIHLHHRIDITDPAGAILETVRFGETLTIEA